MIFSCCKTSRKIRKQRIRERIDLKKTIGAPGQNPAIRQTMSSLPSRKKSTSSRPYERAGRARGVMRKEDKIGASSTESTKLSDKQKMGSVLALKREINEWRRQEELRSKVNQVIERDARVTRATDTGEIKENPNFNDPPKCIVESSTEETDKEVNAETKNDMASARSRSKAKSRKEDMENIPVTWISVQPDASTRTSLRSVADYLSEKEVAESSLLQHRSNRRLCLSPESLSALERAEKLVVDAERQLSQLNLDAVLADDFEEDSNRFVDESSAYIRKIVASSFERGVYEQPPISRSKSELSLASAPASGRTMRPGSSRRKPAAPAIDDDCLLCCGKSARAAVQAPVGVDGCVNSDKLSVQRGPTISIKADLCVRTSRIVDIQPSRDPLPTPGGGSADNVANFEFHHESLANDESAAAEEFEAPGTRDATTSITGLAQPVERPAEPPEPQSRLDLSSDADLSLGEPGIITELDALLSQQRTIIRKVHQSSQALDELLRKSAASEARSPRSSDNAGADYSAESFDSAPSHDSLQASSAVAASSRESCKFKAGFIENLKSSSLQVPKPSNLNVDSTDANGRKEIGKDAVRGIDNEAGINVNANARESRAFNSHINSSKVNENSSEGIYEKESRGPSVISTNKAISEKQGRDPINTDDEKIREKESGDAIDVNANKEVEEKEETEGEDSLHKTSHLIDSLSDDQSLKQLSTQLIVQSRFDSKAMHDNQHHSSTSIRSARADSVLTASAQLIVSRQKSVDLERATAREYSTISVNNRSLLATSQRDGIALLEPPSSDHQKLSLLKKLESCSIPARQNHCKWLPFTSTVLSDAVQPTCSNVESSELSSEATHSEGEFYLSSSASYSLGEVRRKNADSIARSHSSSTKASSTSSAGQLNTPTFQCRCSIGEFIRPINE